MNNETVQETEHVASSFVTEASALLAIAKVLSGMPHSQALRVLAMACLVCERYDEALRVTQDLMDASDGSFTHTVPTSSP